MPEVKEIHVIIRVIDKAQRALATTQKSFSSLKVQARGLQDRMVTLKRTFTDGMITGDQYAMQAQGLRRQFGLLQERFKGTGLALSKFAQVQTLNLSLMNKMQVGWRRIGNFFQQFRMELLGMGFMFMMIGTILASFIQTAMDGFFKLTKYATPLGAAFLDLQGKMQLLNYEFMEAASPALELLMKNAIELINYFTSLDDNTKELIASFIVFTAVIALILSPLSFLILGFYAVGLAVWKIVGIFIFLGQNIVLLGLILIAVIVVLGAIKMAFDALTRHTKDTGDEVKSTIDIWDLLRRVLQGLGAVIIMVSAVFLNFLGLIAYVITSVIILVVGRFMALLETMEYWQKAWAALWDLIGTVLVFAFSQALRGLEPLILQILRLVNSLINGYNQLAQTIGLPLIPQVSIPKGFWDMGIGFGEVAAAAARATGATESLRYSYDNLLDLSPEIKELGLLWETWFGPDSAIGILKDLSEGLWESATAQETAIESTEALTGSLEEQANILLDYQTQLDGTTQSLNDYNAAMKDTTGFAEMFAPGITPETFAGAVTGAIAAEGGFSMGEMNITINIPTISGEADVNELADLISERFVEELRQQGAVKPKP